ncbi:WG repeat-containing protein [Moraxella sp. K1664]|nr:WG repeat-containing protein [Moraxella sp. K1664]
MENFMKKLLNPLIIALSLLPLSALACEKPQVVGYDFVNCLSEGLASVEQNGKWGFIDNTGKVVIPVQYDYVGYFSEGLATVKQNGKFGFIDKTGKVVIPVQYDNAWVFENGKAEVSLNGEFFYIDKTGKRLD